MKKFLLVTTILTGLVANSAFAKGSNEPASKDSSNATVSKTQITQGNTCGLDLIGHTLTMMAQQGLKEGVVTFSSGSDVEETLENLQNDTCSNTKGIKITTKEGIVMVSRSSPSNHYMFSAWYKGGQAVCAILGSDYQIE